MPNSDIISPPQESTIATPQMPGMSGVVNKIPAVPRKPKHASFDFPAPQQQPQFGEDALSSAPAQRQQQVGAGRVLKLDVDQIDVSPYQPRLLFDPEEIIQLANSIEESSQSTPITVRLKNNGRYELIGGERRFRAIKHLQWKTINAIVQDINDADAAIFAVIDNDARVDLSDYERGKAYDKLIKEGRVSHQAALANKIGVSAPTVTRCMAYMKLPTQITALLDQNPKIIGNKHIADFVRLCSEGHTEIVVKYVTEVFEAKISQETALLNIKKELDQKKTQPPEATEVRSKFGRILGKISVKNRAVVFQCERDVDPKTLLDAIQAALSNTST